MDEITKEKNSEHKIMKKKIQNLKQRKYDLKRKNISMSPYKNQKIFLERPNSNYIPRINNNLLEQSKLSLFSNKIDVPNKILVNRKISTVDMHDSNSISFINNSQRRIKNYIYYEDKKQADKSRLNIYKENKIPKSAKNVLKVSKSFLNDNATFTKIYNKEIKKGIRGCKSPLNFSFRNKYLDITKELLGGQKYKKERSINSPSTTNNSNFNDNNSYSSHFLFGKSLMNLNIYPKGINNYFFIDNKYSNKKNKNAEENSKTSTPKLNKINKKFIKKAKDNEILNKTKEFFYQKKYPNNNYQIRNIPFNINNRNQTSKDFSTYVNMDYTNYSKIIKSSKYIPRKKDFNDKKIIKKNKKMNLLIKYAFLNKAIQDIKRKVDFVNPKKGEKITLNTAIVQNDNENNTINNKDFTLVGYELSPKELYELNNNNIKKKEIIKIKKQNEKEKDNKFLTKYSNKDYIEDKIIKPKFFISQRSDNKLKGIKNYRKIDIKKSENKKQRSNDETLEYIQNQKNILNDMQDIFFDFGESLNRNKLDYNMITENDKTEGKKLWSKIYKSSINILRKTKSKLNIKSKVDSNLKISKKKRSNTARPRGGENRKKRKMNQKDVIRRKQKRNNTHKIDTLEQHKLFRNEGGFNEIKQEDNYVYNIDFKLSDESGEDTINEIIEEKKRKEEEENEQEYIESLPKNQISRNSNRSHIKRNTIVDLNPFNNKLYKLKKTSIKILQNKIEEKNKNNINIFNNIINIENETKSKEEKMIKNQVIHISEKTREEKIIRYHTNNRNKIKKLKAQKEKEKLKKKEKKEKSISKKKERNTINILKDNSMEIKNNKILKELNTSINSEYDEFNLSCENEYGIYDMKIENLIKKHQKRRSTLLFDKFFRNYKINMKYKEDEKMQKYFDDIFNKYEKNNCNDNNELVDIKFFGYDLKIKKKNQINFKNILMKNIREQNKIQKENKIINTKLNLILERFNKNKINIYNKNLEIYKASKMNRLQKRKSRLKYKKEIQNNNLDKIEKKETIEEKKEEEFQSQFFFGKRMNSIDEFEKKKDELLTLIEDGIRDRINKGDIGHSEMKQFLEFQKRMNTYQIDKNNKNSFIQLLEQEFISFQDQIKIHEQKLKEERRLNKFLNRLNDDIQKDFYYKNFQKKMFCNVIDYNEKNIINLLSSTKQIQSN